MSNHEAQPYKPVKADRDDWETPPEIFDPLDEEFHFALDVAASNENAKGDTAAWFTKEEDAIGKQWFGTCWCNPPYDAKSLTRFTAKAISESKRGVTTVMLVPPKTDQQWWHDLVAHGAEFRFVLGRIKFIGAKHGAPDPSVVIVVRPRPKQITGKQGPQALGGEG